MRVSWSIVMMYTLIVFFFNDTATTEIYTLSLHDALPISCSRRHGRARPKRPMSANFWRSWRARHSGWRSEEHTSELQSRQYLVCRLLLEKKKKNDRELFHKDHEVCQARVASRLAAISSCR